VSTYQVDHGRRVPDRGDKQSVPLSERHQRLACLTNVARL
jgi:hypothetical protein